MEEAAKIEEGVGEQLEDPEDPLPKDDDEVLESDVEDFEDSESDEDSDTSEEESSEEGDSNDERLKQLSEAENEKELRNAKRRLATAPKTSGGRKVLVVACGMVQIRL
jgi:hypothetical protein